MLYADPEPTGLHDSLDVVDEPLNQLTDPELRPGAEALEQFSPSLR